MSTIKHILVPTDFSETSDRALALALELARAFDARITLLHVWSVPNFGYAEALTWPVDAMQQAAKKALDDVLASTSKAYPKTEALLSEGNEWKQIVAAVKQRGCDLVVMGTHGRRGIPRLVLGSVAEKVVRLSAAPVVTVGPPNEPRQ